MEVKTFYAKLKKHCNKINRNCEQCFFRFHYCFNPPFEKSDKTIDDAIAYLSKSEEL